MPGKEKVEEQKIEIPEEQVEKPPEGYTEEEWIDLSKAEKEGIMSKEAEDGSTIEEEEFDEEVLKEIAGEEEEVKEEKKEAKEPEKKEEKEKVSRETEPKVEAKPDEPPVVEEPEKKPDEEKPVVESVSDEQLLRFRAIVGPDEIKVELKKPAELQEKLKGINAKYDAGEITIDERDGQREDLLDTWRESRDTEKRRMEREVVWQKEQRYFLHNRPIYTDKSVKANALFGALTQFVTELDKDPNFSGLPGMELLIAADKKVKEAFGLDKQIEKEKVEAKPTEKKEEKKGMKPAAKIPDHKTIGDLPPAESNLTDSPFTALDNMSGDALEDALERMTQSQRDRYLDALKVGR